jgi:hypothetical protein
VQSAVGEERPAVTLPRITFAIAIARLAVERALGEDDDLRPLDEDFGGRRGRGRDDGAMAVATMMIAIMVSMTSAARRVSGGRRRRGHAGERSAPAEEESQRCWRWRDRHLGRCPEWQQVAIVYVGTLPTKRTIRYLLESVPVNQICCLLSADLSSFFVSMSADLVSADFPL